MPIDPRSELRQQDKMTLMSSDRKKSLEINDGRRARSRTSRQRIADAMMALIAGGEMMPSAARVAEEAGVGLRTVFRHFDDMDALYADISATISQQVLPIALAPYENADWRDNVRELAHRRVRVFETMLPYRLAASARRHSSPLLLGQYVRVIQLEREFALRQLPDEVRSNRIVTESICAALSFQNWCALRHDQMLSSEEAGTIALYMIDSLLASLTNESR